MKSLIYFFAVALFFSIACQHKQDKGHKDLAIADSLMFISPDSSLKILENFKDAESLDKEGLAYYALLLSQARARNYIIPDNDSLIKVALNYYSTSKDSLMKARTYLYAYDTYKELGQESKALYYIQSAAKAAYGLNDNRLLSYIYYYWGYLLQNEPPFEEAEKKYFEAKKYATANKDTALEIGIISGLGRIYFQQNDYIASLAMMNEGIKLSRKLKKPAHSSYSLYGYSALLLEIDNQNIEALKLINESLKFDLDEMSLKQTYLVKGRIFMKLNQFDSAQYYLKKGIQNEGVYARANYNDIMSLLEVRRGNYKAALEHRIACSKQMDSVRDSLKRKELMDLQKKYDLSTIEAERDKLQIEKQHDKIIIMVIVILFLLASIGIIVWRSFVNNKMSKLVAKTKRQLSTHEQNTEKKIQSIKEREKTNYAKKEAELLSELNDKNNQIEAILSRNKLIGDILFEQYPIVQKIRSFGNRNAKAKMTDKPFTLTKPDFYKLIEALNLCHNNFADNLTNEYPSLSKDEQLLCFLIKMGENSNDIAALMDVSAETLRKRKSRLKNEKMANGAAANFDSLDSFIDSF